MFKFDIVYVNDFSAVLRIALSIVSGTLIGIERGKHGRAAGLRTHALVCLGSCISSIVGMYMVSVPGFDGDPSRIPAGVVSGVGFLGAGMILVKNNSRVTGLTTAAAMWATANVGLAYGAGLYIIGFIGTITIFFALTTMSWVESKQQIDKRFFIETNNTYKTNEVIDEIKNIWPQAHSFDIFPAKSGIDNHIGISFNINSQEDILDAREKICSINSVVYAVEE